MELNARTAMFVIGLAIALGVGSTAHATAAAADGFGPLYELVDDAAQRLLTADPVAASKYLTGGAVDDPVREQQVLDSVEGLARANHVDSSFVHEVFRDQISATDSLEHSLFAEWKIDSGSVPKTAPDLTSSRNAINALNQSMVVDLAQQWNALHTAACPADLATAKAAVETQRHLDPTHQRALDYAARHYCS